MGIYLLSNRIPHINECEEKIVRAKSSKRAREVANGNEVEEKNKIWENEDITNCVYIEQEGDEEILIESFNCID